MHLEQGNEYYYCITGLNLWLDIRKSAQINGIIFIREMKMGLVPGYLSEQLRYVNGTELSDMRKARNFSI